MELLFLPCVLCGAMVLCAVVTGYLAHVDARALFLPYFGASIAVTILSTLASVFWWVIQLARVRADAPLRNVCERLRARSLYLLLPAVIFPLFLSSFTAVKTAIPLLVGYSWDPFWAEADRMIFGDDAWRIAHHWLGAWATFPLEWSYSVAWGLALVFVMALVPLNASLKFTSKFYSAMMATWLIAGVALAYLFSAAGPVFAHLASSSESVQFADLRRALQSSLAPHSPIRLTQQYLASALHSRVAAKGGGISAMPSMHLGVASIYVLGARNTRWFIPAIAFWLIIFISSAYFGYHYWIDGLVAAAVAWASWRASEFYLESGLFCFASEERCRRVVPLADLS